MKAARKYPRFPKDCQVRYKVLDVQQEEMQHAGTTVNISGGGACFKSESMIPTDSVLAVEITVPGTRTPIVAIGKAVWSKQNDDGTYESGVEFWWLGYRGEETSTAPVGITRTE